MVPEKKPFQSRFLPNHSTAAAATASASTAAKKDESESSSEEETTSEESEEEEEAPKAAPAVAARSDSTAFNRASAARDAYATTRRNSRDETSLRNSGYSSPTYGRSVEQDSTSRYSSTSGVRSRANPYAEPDDHSRYGSGSSG